MRMEFTKDLIEVYIKHNNDKSCLSNLPNY